MSQMMNDDNITVDISKSSISKLAKAMGGGGAKGKMGGKGGLGGMMGIMQKGLGKIGIIGIAVGSILGVVKSLAGSSPMLKQMMKLMNFSIMMILRPIGDFIGFMLRPILIMLLRNIIIPFYKEYMPLMRAWGSFFGGAILDFFNNPSTYLAAAVTGLNTWVTTGLQDIFDGKVDWVAVGESIKNGLLTFIKNTPNAIIATVLADTIRKLDFSKLTAEWSKVGESVKIWWNKGIASIGVSWNSFWTGISNWFNNGINSIATKWSNFWGWIANWFWGGIQGISASWSNFWQWIKDWVYNGIQSISASWSDIWGWLKDWIWNGIQSIGSGVGSILGFADGGQINEPILGFGQSGQMYSFGEKGSETITPNNGSGGGGITLNISVGNISSEGDMRNFESRVLEVLENANSRRGRV
jgi:hypothetical protein